MYVCGPTVYDVAHMGHARAYLTFDIMRRILEDYFNYHVLFQVNITDVDDKIILKARKGALMKDYGSKGLTVEEAKKDASLAFQKRRSKLEADKLATEKRLAPDAAQKLQAREKEEAINALKSNDLFVQQLQEAEARVSTASVTSDVIDACADFLADWLDDSLGHTVSDKAVFNEHGRKYEEQFLQDCVSLGIRDPTVITRVSDYVEEIVSYIEALVKQGYAYNSNGSVYFDTTHHKQSHDYPKLVPSAGSGQTDAELAEGEGALGAKFDGEKRHRNDFALWKASKAGEPRWSSPWGEGRPGWHIECSVMIKEIHGDRLDIHGGGADLRFPHHDNEIAQAEAFHECQQWCNYFTHAGHLHIKGLKMSKSLKNFVTIRQALESYTARQLRLMFLSHGWDRPLNFSDQSITEAQNKESRLNSFFAVVETAVREAPIASSPQKWDDADRALYAALRGAQARVHEHLCDNLNTPDAMDALDAVVSAVHTYLKAAAAAKSPLLRACADYVRRILGVFGVVLGGDSGGGGDDAAAAAAAIDAFVKHRDALRQLATQTKNADLMRMCDSLRDGAFVDLGVRVADREAGLGAQWSREDAAALRKEAEGKAAERRERERQKAANLLAAKEKELARLEAARAPPAALFRGDARFGAWDEAGLPTQLAGGEAVPKSLGKTCAKEMERYAKDHEALAAKGGDGYLDELRAEAAALRAAVGAAGAPAQ